MPMVRRQANRRHSSRSSKIWRYGRCAPIIYTLHIALRLRVWILGGWVRTIYLVRVDIGVGRLYSTGAHLNYEVLKSSTDTQKNPNELWKCYRMLKGWLVLTTSSIYLRLSAFARKQRKFYSRTYVKISLEIRAANLINTHLNEARR